ncbi:MAG: hypothetical protein R2939_20445 [Kofleriaceae bacterium]
MTPRRKPLSAQRLRPLLFVVALLGCGAAAPAPAPEVGHASPTATPPPPPRCFPGDTFDARELDRRVRAAVEAGQGRLGSCRLVVDVDGEVAVIEGEAVVAHVHHCGIVARSSQLTLEGSEVRIGDTIAAVLAERGDPADRLECDGSGAIVSCGLRLAVGDHGYDPSVRYRLEGGVEIERLEGGAAERFARDRTIVAFTTSDYCD